MKATIINLTTTKEEYSKTVETLMSELHNARLLIEKQNRQNAQNEELISKVIAAKEEHIQNLIKSRGNLISYFCSEGKRTL